LEENVGERSKPKFSNYTPERQWRSLPQLVQFDTFCSRPIIPNRLKDVLMGATSFKEVGRDPMLTFRTATDALSTTFITGTPYLFIGVFTDRLLSEDGAISTVVPYFTFCDPFIFLFVLNAICMKKLKDIVIRIHRYKK